LGLQRVESYSSEISVDYLIAQNAGNFNFGGMGAALGFKLEDLLRGAGGENVLNNVLNAGSWSGLVQGRLGVPGMVAPYGDDRVDQYLGCEGLSRNRRAS
jgi:Bacterial toxin 44